LHPVIDGSGATRPKLCPDAATVFAQP